MNNKQKQTLKGWSIAAFIFLAFCVVGEMDYQDSIAKNSNNVISVTE